MTRKGFYSFRELQEKSLWQCLALEIVGQKQCPLNCENCYITKSRPEINQNGRMPQDFVIKCIQQAKEVGFTEIVFIGGEPTLHPELDQFISFTRSLDLSPILCTNGLYLKDLEYCQKILLPGTTVVIHALLPGQEELLDQHVKFPGYARALKTAYRNLKQLPRLTIVAELPLIERFLPLVPDYYRWCHKNGYTPFLEINRMKNDFQSYNGSTSPEQIKQVFSQLTKIDQELGLTVPEEICPPAYGIFCTMSITGLHVKNFGNGNYGKVFSCCAQHIEHGNLREQSLQEILQHPSMAIFKNQDQWIYGPCRACQYYPKCQGGCRGEAFLRFKCPRASCPACWHIPANVRNDPQVMRPPSCVGCPLKANPACGFN